MMNNFEKWDKEFSAHNMFAFNGNANGLLWLKVRAISRRELMDRFIKENKLSIKSKKISEQNEELFLLLENPKELNKEKNLIEKLDDFLKQENNEWYKAMGVDEDILKNELYLVQNYSWGGDQNNSLDKYLVKHYVKEEKSFKGLQSKKAAIENNAWNYVETSWYNNWTSYLIESIFKRNKKVISAIGEIKGVDFFIDSFPIDLKVTYFPKEYMEEKLKDALGNKELTWLKREAKKQGITVDEDLTDSQKYYALTEKLNDSGHGAIVEKLKEERRRIVDASIANKSSLMKWLYENQGEMRFGSENRLFLILVDSKDMNDSWKLKRNIDLIKESVDNYIDNFNNNSLEKIEFTFNKKEYISLADIIFIIAK